jgi:hypothetical protein
VRPALEGAETKDLLAASEQRAAAAHELSLRPQRAIMPAGVRLAAAVPADPGLDSHVARILARAAPDTGDDACLLAVRIR